MATQQKSSGNGIFIAIGILILLIGYAYNASRKNSYTRSGKVRYSGYTNRDSTPATATTPLEQEPYKGLTDREKDRIWRRNLPVTTSAEERKSLRESQEP